MGAELKLSDCGESGGIDLDLSAKCGVLAVGCSPSDFGEVSVDDVSDIGKSARDYLKERIDKQGNYKFGASAKATVGACAKI